MTTRSALTTSWPRALLTGCGGGDDSSKDPGTTGGGSAAASGAIGMKDIQFSPKESTVKVGQKVTWTNHESVQHNVKADSGASFSSKLLAQDQSFSYTPTKAGRSSTSAPSTPGWWGR